MPTILQRGCDPSFFFGEPGQVTVDDGAHRPITASSVNVEAVCCYMRTPAMMTNVYIVLPHPSKPGGLAVLRKSWVNKFETNNGLFVTTDYENVPFAKGFGERSLNIWGQQVYLRDPGFVMWPCHTDTARTKLIASLEAIKAYDTASVVTLGVIVG